MRGVASDVAFSTIDRADHGVPEENADAITDLLERASCMLTGDRCALTNDHVWPEAARPHP